MSMPVMASGVISAKVHHQYVKVGQSVGDCEGQPLDPIAAEWPNFNRYARFQCERADLVFQHGIPSNQNTWQAELGSNM